MALDARRGNPFGRVGKLAQYGCQVDAINLFGLDAAGPTTSLAVAAAAVVARETQKERDAVYQLALT